MLIHNVTYLQGRIQKYGLGVVVSRPLPSPRLPSPSRPFPFPLFPSPSPLLFVPSLRLPSPLPLDVAPLIQLGGLGSTVSSPAGSGEIEFGTF